MTGIHFALPVVKNYSSALGRKLGLTQQGQHLAPGTRWFVHTLAYWFLTTIFWGTTHLPSSWWNWSYSDQFAQGQALGGSTGTHAYILMTFVISSLSSMFFLASLMIKILATPLGYHYNLEQS